jgi:hypothetical protein
MGRCGRFHGRRLQAVRNLVGSSGEIRMILSGLKIGVLACISKTWLVFSKSGS